MQLNPCMLSSYFALQVGMCAARCVLWRKIFVSVPPLLLRATRHGVSCPATRGPKCCSGIWNLPLYVSGRSPGLMLRLIEFSVLSRLVPVLSHDMYVCLLPVHSTGWWVSSGSTVNVCRSCASCAKLPAPPPPSLDSCSTTAAGLSSETLSSPTGHHWVREQMCLFVCVYTEASSIIYQFYYSFLLFILSVSRCGGSCCLWRLHPLFPYAQSLTSTGHG